MSSTNLSPPTHPEGISVADRTLLQLAAALPRQKGQGIVLGVSLVLLAALIIVTGWIPRPVGYLFGISGIADIAVGWIVGSAGFAPQGALPSYVGQTCLFVAGMWLLIATWRMPSDAASMQRLPEQRAGEPARGGSMGGTAPS